MGRLRITSGVDVAAPPDRARAVVTDFARNPEWQGGIRICEWLTTPPLAVGSRITADVAGEPDGVLGWFGPVMARLVQRGQLSVPWVMTPSSRADREPGHRVRA